MIRGRRPPPFSPLTEVTGRRLQNFAATAADAELGPARLVSEDGSRTEAGLFLQADPPPPPPLKSIEA
jgi:hypothetical protein